MSKRDGSACSKIVNHSRHKNFSILSSHSCPSCSFSAQTLLFCFALCCRKIAGEPMAMAKMDYRSFMCTLLLLLLCHQSSALMTTITHQECVYEEVQFDGDHVSGSFVVVDHGLSWNSGEEGVDLVVSSLPLHFFSTFLKCLSRTW